MLEKRPKIGISPIIFLSPYACAHRGIPYSFVVEIHNKNNRFLPEIC
jgi:hypothetical protein